MLAFVIVGLTGYCAWRFTTSTMSDHWSATLAAVTVFFAVFLGAFHLQGYLELMSGRPVISLTLTGGLVAVAAGAALLRPKRSGRSNRASGYGEALHRDGLRPIAFLIGIGTLTTFALLAMLLLLALPRGFEVRAYHLPIAVRILRDGTLGFWDHAYMHAFPANMSIWAGFFMAVVPERWVAIVNLPFLALLCAAVMALCRSVDSDRSAAIVVTAGLVTIPIFGFSAIEVGADVAGVAFVCVAASMIATKSGLLRSRALYAGLACGIAFGFKSLNLIPAVVLGLALFTQCLLERGLHPAAQAPGPLRRTWSTFSPVVYFVFSALAMMSFWLCRNEVEAGNPLYPVHVAGLFDALGWTAAPDFDLRTRMENEHEWVAQSRGWLEYPWVEGHVIHQNFKHSSGLGPFFAATIPVVLVLWPVAWLTGRPDPAAGGSSRSFAESMLFIVAIAVIAGWWTLGDRQPRYVMVAIALLCPLGAKLITLTAGRLRTAYETLLAIGILAMAFVLLFRLGIENLPFLLNQSGASRAQSLEYPAAIDDLPTGSVIANAVDRPASYALLGSGFRNHVVDSAEVMSRFETSDHRVSLTAVGVQKLGITHLYVYSGTRLETEPCLKLREVGRLDRNPFNGRPLEEARILYSVDADCRNRRSSRAS